MTRRPLSPLQIRNPKFAIRNFALLVALCALPLTLVRAQSSTANLSGTVEDQNGALVAGANITVLDVNTRRQRETTTNDHGYFVVPLLPPTTYKVSVSRNGFATVEVQNVVLNVGDQKSLQIQLKPGDISETVQITGEAPLINISPAVATTIDRQFVGNLPLNGRSFQSLIFLTPGVVYTPSQFQNPGEFSVNGQRTNANYFTVDGVAANTGISSATAGNALTSNSLAGMLPGLGASGSTSALVSADALEEFKIQTSTYSAQYGRQPGAQVQLVSRSGTNDFHGTLFEYIRNEAFDARNWFNMEPAQKPPTRLNQFGGTFSGPVYLPRFGEGSPGWYKGKDRTFFFFSYEGQRLRLPATVQGFVPSLRIRQVAQPAFRPVLNAFPLPTGDEIIVNCDAAEPGCSADGTDPSGMAPFFASFSNPKSQDATSIRIDHRIGDKHSVFGRYNDAPSHSLNRQFAQLFGSVFDSQTFTLGVTSSLTSRISNDFRFNHARSRAAGTGWLDDFGGAVPIDVSVLLPGYTGELKNVQGRFGFGRRFAGGADIFIGDNAENQQRQYNFVDNVNWITGNHAVSFGLDYRRLAPIYGPLQYRQETDAFMFSLREMVSFLNNGIVPRADADGQGTAVRPRFDNFSAYFQDSWKVSRRLTLDLGLRWEFNPTPSEANGRNPVFVTGAEDLATARLLRPDEKWYKTDYTAFAPRIGAAYLLSQKAGLETVLRGGFGVFHDLNAGLATAAYTGFPFVVNKFIGRNIAWPFTAEQAALPSQPVVALPILSPLRAINDELRLPYTLQWNLSAEQSLGKSQSVTIGYVASAGRRLTTNQRLNQPIGDPFEGPRPNPNFGDINYVSNGPTSDYHSMQVQYQRRLSHGLQALVNYTWSHAIDEVSNEVEQGTLTRGNASFDIRHNFTAALTYNIPRWKRFSVVDAILRDWSIDTVILAYSGRPLDITVGGSLVDNSGNFQVVRPDLVPGIPIWIEDGNAPGGMKINAAAFALPPIIPDTFDQRFAREGTLGRNVVREPGIHQVNLSIRREFGFSERVKLQMRAEAFNLFNTPLFSGYSTSFFPGDTFFGLATTTLNNQSSGGGLNSLYALGGPRSMQFSIRLSF